MTDTVPYYEDFVEIKKKIWSMLDNAIKDRGSPFRIPVFICGDQSDLDGRIVVLRKSDQLNNIVQVDYGVAEYNVDMSATILTSLVPLFVYFISGRWFVRGIAAGAIKG